MKNFFTKIGLSLVLIGVIYLEFYNGMFLGEHVILLLFFMVLFNDYKGEKIRKNMF